MPNLPQTVNVDLSDLITLINYYWSAVNSPDVGELGTATYEETVNSISRQSAIRVTPEQLENLVFHMKQAIFEKIKPRLIDIKHKNYYKTMKRLSDAVPQLFKTLPSGEIVFINFEDRANDTK